MEGEKGERGEDTHIHTLPFPSPPAPPEAAVLQKDITVIVIVHLGRW